jgi:hypothetical protein
VNVRPNLRSLNHFGIFDDPFFGRLFKDNILWLCGSTVRADFHAAWISATAIWTFPFKFYIAK